MLNTEKFYDSAYCKKIDAKKWRHRQIPNVMKVIYDHFKPSSLIDVGCANGLHLKAFKELGVTRLFGIEGTSHFAPYIEKYFGDQYIISDLRHPLPYIGKFDLVISFEVLEHLEKGAAKRAVENLINLGNTLCVSANPSKGGFYHLNPKPKEYWLDIFTSFDMIYCGDEVNKLQSIFSKMNCSQWFKTDLMVFRHD
jgi:SAM-dependent methyltransferase